MDSSTTPSYVPVMPHLPPVESMAYHPKTEKLVEMITQRTRINPLFVRVVVGYYFSMIAATMRASIITHDRGPIPVNLYALGLSPSGTGKGVTTGFMENNVIHLFREKFLQETYGAMAEKALPKFANKRAIRKGTDPDEELPMVTKDFERLGEPMLTFCDATVPAIKQQRVKLLITESAAMNLQVDEIGSNLAGIIDCLPVFLELYDIGKCKNKLIKNTAEESRFEEIDGPTPMNMLLFGTPSALLNGGAQEDALYSLLETGYARRCFFGFHDEGMEPPVLTAEQIYAMRTNKANDQWVEQFAQYLEKLADVGNMHRPIKMSKDVALKLIQYQLDCEESARKLPKYDEVRKAEMIHRYFKVMKLAGAYAFIDNSPEMLEEHLYAAIRLAEESGKAFHKLLTPEKKYVKLAKYLGGCKAAMTHADLVDNLPFYPKASASARSDLLNLAIAWGYKNNIIIKKSFDNGIEFLTGDTLEETDLAQLVVSYSTDIAMGYQNQYAPWDQLHKLTNNAGFHWVNHHLEDGHRCEENAIKGFNMVVVDVDGTAKLELVREVLKDKKYLIYTTKRHTPECHRFRVILPTNYKLEMDPKDFKEFMVNLCQSLGFEVDSATHQRARKWLSHDAHYEYNEGELLDVLPYIPKTAKNEERKILLSSQQNLDSLERWFINNTGDGNRNNMLLRFATMLVDADMSFEDVRSKVLQFNGKLPDKLEDTEIFSTILATVKKRLDKRADGGKQI